MIPIRVKVQRLTPTAKLPTRATAGAAGFDLYSDEDFMSIAGTRHVISTGLRIEVPEGYEAQVRARSGLARDGFIIANAPGTIDSDYRGEVKVLLVNLGCGDIKREFRRGDRIAQLVFQKLPDIIIEEAPVEETSTARGAGGFGSTGK